MAWLVAMKLGDESAMTKCFVESEVWMESSTSDSDISVYLKGFVGRKKIEVSMKTAPFVRFRTFSLK